MLSQKDLSTLSKGDIVDHYLLIKKFEVRLTRQNKQYLNMELGDKSETLNANVFDNFEDIYNSFKNGEVVKVNGIIDDYQGTKQIRINFPTAPTSPHKRRTTCRASERRSSTGQSKKEFVKRIDTLSDYYLKTLMKTVFDEERLDKFFTAPAGKSWHHGYIHGL